MARRSPMNERYQKNTAPSGKTRKSAAAAKPKRQAASSSKSSKKPGSKSGSASARPALAVNPQTPEFRFWRRIWWAMLGTSMVLAVATWFLVRNPALEQYGRAGLIVSYVLIGGSLFLDLTKLRRMRREWIATGGHPEKAESARKADTTGDATRDTTHDTTGDTTSDTTRDTTGDTTRDTTGDTTRDTTASKASTDDDKS